MQSFRSTMLRRSRSDEGVALVAAVGVVMLVALLAATIVTVAVYEARATGRDRARSSAVAVAEARVDTLTSTIQSTAPADLPCGPVDDQMTVATETFARTATVTYYAADGTVVPCASVPNTAVTQASIKTTAETGPIVGTQPAERTVETLIRLTPSYGNDLNKAIFGDAGIQLANQANIYGQNGQPDADVYTNGDVTCSNNQHYFGSIVAQGTVRLQNQCVVEVDVHAKLGIEVTNPQSRINGRALVSNGNISLGPGGLGQQARASGTVTGNICTTTGKCFPASTGIPTPATAEFPKMTWAKSTDWTLVSPTNPVAYQVKTFDYTVPGECGMYSAPGPLNGKVDMVGKWIYENMASRTVKTIIMANCPGQPVKLQGVGITLNEDLVVYSKAGVNFSGNTQITSTTADHRRLYLIQPYDAVTVHPCTADGIALDNQVNVQNSVDVLLYSPCNIRKANNTDHYGQIYAGGKAIIDNSLEMYFKPLPVVGIEATTQAVLFYNVEILYKRENVG